MISPELEQVKNLELPMPGTYLESYTNKQPLLQIKEFSPVFKVISSKQRPRKLTIVGSDSGLSHLPVLLSPSSCLLAETAWLAPLPFTALLSLDFSCLVLPCPVHLLIVLLGHYPFLLKGHEDLRQDERAMQLFGLVNNFLSSNDVCNKAHLSIQRFSVVPLSADSGMSSAFLQSLVFAARCR